jgi:hypothetical protein
MSSSQKNKTPERRRIDMSRLTHIINCNAPIGLGYRDRPVVHVGHVEPTLADSAHCVWEEGNAKVYLGPARAAGLKARESLLQAGVGAIINCTRGVPCHHREDRIRYCRVPIYDNAGADILVYLTGATTFLDFNLRQGFSVLVHCEMGISRSATVVLAYLMRYHNMTRDQSYTIIKQRRPKIDPNEGFWQQLLIWQHQMIATTSTTTTDTTDTSSANIIDDQGHGNVDRDWAQMSSALFSTCREMEGSDLSHACFGRCVTAKDRKHTLEVCLDFVWGRGVSTVDVDWLAVLCRYLAEKDNDDHGDHSSKMHASVQRQVLAMLEDVDSDFASQWSGEIHPEQMERIQRALGCDAATTCRG